MKKILLGTMMAIAACGPAATGGGATSPGAGGGGGDVGTITIRNASSYDIYSLQLSPYTSTSWGQNLIGDDVLLHGDAQRVSVFDCEKYDLRLVDHESDECVIQDIDLCFQDKDWEITDGVLAVCQTAWAVH